MEHLIQFYDVLLLGLIWFLSGSSLFIAVAAVFGSASPDYARLAREARAETTVGR